MLARSSDPITSHAAADRAQRFAGSHRARILAALREHGPSTAHELERHTGLSYVQVDRRMHELVKRQEAKATTSKRQTPTGGQALVWEAV